MKPMITEMIGNIPTTSITDLKTNPMGVIDQSKQLKDPVYLLNRNKPVAVIMDNEQYEIMREHIEILEERVLDMETEKRLETLGNENNNTNEQYSAEEVIGKPLSEVEYQPDEWE